MRALHAIANTPWCITEDALRTIVTIAKREQPDIAALETQIGRKLDYTRTVTERGGVATIPIDGPIFRKANLLTEMSGATSLEILARDFSAALHNPQVRAILFAIDSPGGEVTGIHEFADLVYDARGKKPIVAYVEGLGASAAYWIASACDSIVCDATAMLGSIGVIAVVDNAENPDELIFVSTQSPNKRPDLRTDDGKLAVQTAIDATADVFIASVARNRGVKPQTVQERYGAGGVKVGQEAVAAGLADKLGSYEQTLLSLQGRTPHPISMQATAITTNSAPGTPVPEIAAQVQAAIESMAHPTARKPAQRAHTTRTKETPMSDDTRAPDVGALPDLALNDAAMQAQMSAYVTQLEARYAAQQEQAFTRAQAEFERRIADMEQRRQIESYAQHITTPTMSRQHALPGQAETYSAFLMSLNGDSRKAAMGILDSILTAGLVSFEEIGSSGEGDTRDVKDQFAALVAAKVAGGMSRVEAIKAVAKEQPALYAAQSSLKGGK